MLPSSTSRCQDGPSPQFGAHREHVLGAESYLGETSGDVGGNTALLVGDGSLTALWALLTRSVPIFPSTLLLIVVFAILGFCRLAIGVHARTGNGPLSWIVSTAHGIVLSTYTWL